MEKAFQISALCTILGSVFYLGCFQESYARKFGGRYEIENVQYVLRENNGKTIVEAISKPRERLFELYYRDELDKYEMRRFISDAGKTPRDFSRLELTSFQDGKGTFYIEGEGKFEKSKKIVEKGRKEMERFCNFVEKRFQQKK